MSFVVVLPAGKVFFFKEVPLVVSHLTAEKTSDLLERSFYSIDGAGIVRIPPRAAVPISSS